MGLCSSAAARTCPLTPQSARRRFPPAGRRRSTRAIVGRVPDSEAPGERKGAPCLPAQLLRTAEHRHIRCCSAGSASPVPLCGRLAAFPGRSGNSHFPGSSFFLSESPTPNASLESSLISPLIERRYRKPEIQNRNWKHEIRKAKVEYRNSGNRKSKIQNRLTPSTQYPAPETRP
jgi:hypothetical protein